MIEAQNLFNTNIMLIEFFQTQQEVKALFEAVRIKQQRQSDLSSAMVNLYHRMIRKYYHQMTQGKEYNGAEFAEFLRERGESEETCKIMVHLDFRTSRKKNWIWNPDRD